MNVECEWGPMGAADAGRGMVVVVDVLSFSTAVTVAVSRGTAVYAASPGAAALVAQEVDAVLASRRGEETADRPWSLSPAALLQAPMTPRLVLPSPNGSAIAARAAPGTHVVAGCLRNASAVAHYVATLARTVTVVPAGERWPDGSLRPALEDWLGAGAIVSRLRRMATVDLSPEAEAAGATFEATTDVTAAVAACASGRELRDRGYGTDVAIAAEVDGDRSVPLLVDGAFRPVG